MVESTAFTHTKTSRALTLEKQACDLLSASALSTSSLTTYRQAVSHYANFVHKTYNSSKLFPTPLQTLVTFVMDLFNNSKSPATINTYITALSYVNKMLGEQDATRSFVIKKLLAATQRCAGQPDCRLPITVSILKRIITSLATITSLRYEKLLMKALILTVFHALLRVGEVTARASSNGANILQISDCEFELCKTKATSMSITIREFKHNTSRKPFTITIQSENDCEFCPVSAVIDYIKLRGNKDGPLFCLSDGQPVPRYHVSDILRRAISFIGLDNRHFKCHSLRIGAATSLIAQGVPDEQVQRMGRWNSSAFKRYIRIPRYTTIH